MPIILEVHHLRSSDVNDLVNWKPKSLDEVFYPLDMDIGQFGATGSNIFYVLIATPEALRRQAEEYRRANRVFPDRNLLVFPDYSWDFVVSRVDRIVKLCTRESWNESVTCLNRYFAWEYEDYFRFPPA
jgi:hypothetical protein